MERLQHNNKNIVVMSKILSPDNQEFRSKHRF